MQTLQKKLFKKNNSLNGNNIFDSMSVSTTSFDNIYQNNIQDGGNLNDLRKKTHRDVSKFINNNMSEYEKIENNSESEIVSDSDTSVFLNNTAKKLNQLNGGNVELNTNASTEEFLDYVENKLNNNLTGGDINNILQDPFIKGGYIDNDTITQQDILNRLRLYVNQNQEGGDEPDDDQESYDDQASDSESGQDGGKRKNNLSEDDSSSSEDDFSNSSSDSDSSDDSSEESEFEKSSSIKIKVNSKRPKSLLVDKTDDSDYLDNKKQKNKRSVFSVFNNDKVDDDDEDDEDVDDDDEDEEDDEDDHSEDDDEDDEETDSSNSEHKKKDKKNKKVDYSADSLSSIIISSEKGSITPYMMSSDHSLQTDDINLISFSPKNKRNKKK
jgi:hypothetical protein